MNKNERIKGAAECINSRNRHLSLSKAHRAVFQSSK